MKLPVKSDLEKRDLAPVSQKSENCSGATIPFISLQGQGSKPSTWFFLHQKYRMLKYRLFKTGGLQFDNWLLGPQRVLRTFEKQAQETCLSLQHFVINFSDKQVKVMEIYFHLSRTELTHISITVGLDI